MALKRLIARRGTAVVFHSDNAKTFVAASMWVGKINKDEQNVRVTHLGADKMEI